MRLSLNEKKVSLSAGEFAEFRLGPTDIRYGRTGRWRLELGQTWHQELRAQSEAEYSNATFEVPIKGTCLHKDWSVSIQGRIDQVIHHGSSVTLKEIKTVKAALPLPEEELLENYRPYFVQLAAYLVLADLDPAYRDTFLHGELIFIDIAGGDTGGDTQSVLLGPEHTAHFKNQLDVLHSFLEQRWLATHRLRRIKYTAPFPNLRPGQEHTREILDRAANQSKVILFEAPTGFGKTGIVLEFALARLRDGHFDRVIFLTGKSTGQIQILRQLNTMLLEDGGLQYFQLRNKSEHAQDCALRHCDFGYGCKRELEERWERAGISPMHLFNNGSIPLSRIKDMAEKNGVCPYEISRSALPFADVWVADYNYIFNPNNNSVLFEQPGFESSQTLLIIDEGHNLPSRVADAYSLSYDRSEAENVFKELQFANVAPSLLFAYEQWLIFIEKIEKTDRVDEIIEKEASMIIDNLVKELQLDRIDPNLFSNTAYDKLWSCPMVKNFLNQSSLEKLVWAPESGSLNFTCLSAATEIGRLIQSFGQTVIMSATLSPRSIFMDACGIQSEMCQWVDAEAEWRNEAYKVAVDTRVDTRLKSRSRHYATTAQTVGLMSHLAIDPIVVYFPSYRYAHTIVEYLKATYSDLRIAIQPRNLNLAEQYQFIEDALISADTLFLVLGSGFSESIDLLGGRVTSVIVVGPALPEVNANQRAKMEANCFLSREEAFFQVYQVPAMIKINQALGRLVRAPRQHAKVLLHCRRFKEDSYMQLLAPEYRHVSEIKSEDDLIKWYQDD